MRRKKLHLCAILFLGLGITALQAQKAIPTSGGEASGSGGSASFTIGQVFYTTNSGTNGSVSQGVQQPYEISVVSGIEEINGFTMKCTIYPNPTTDLLILKVDVSTPFSSSNGELISLQSLSYQLYDFSGKLIEHKKLSSNETTIKMKKLEQAIYFLKVTQTKRSISQEVKTFKIIKN